MENSRTTVFMITFKFGLFIFSLTLDSEIVLASVKTTRSSVVVNLLLPERARGQYLRMVQPVLLQPVVINDVIDVLENEMRKFQTNEYFVRIDEHHKGEEYGPRIRAVLIVDDPARRQFERPVNDRRRNS